jgi:heptosyltransferase-2
MKRKILLVRISSLGDVVLTLPVIESIKQHLRDSQLDFLTGAQYTPLVEQFPGIEHVHAFDKGEPFPLKILRNHQYDTVIDLQKNPRSIIMTARINPKNVSSYPKRRWQRELLVRQWPLKFRIGHTVDAYLLALARLKIPPASRIPRLALGEQLISSAREFIDKAALDGKIIGLCPGSKHFEKRWSRFDELARLLLKDGNRSVIVFSDNNDEFRADLNISSQRLIAARGLKFDLLAGIISRCDAVVTNDSGLMHLAVALGVPVAAIFGPTHPDLGFAPLGARDIVICDHVGCSPCSLHGEKKCRMPHKYCFENITPERIEKEVDGLINETGRGQILREASRQ